MNFLLIRAIVTVISGVSTLYLVLWVGGALIFALHLPLWMSFAGALLAAVVAARYVWVHTASMQTGLVSSIVLGALTIGGIGFTTGFFGPIVFAPDANQGPLLGIFITGPLGFLLGAVAGTIYWFARGRHKTQESDRNNG